MPNKRSSCSTSSLDTDTELAVVRSGLLEGVLIERDAELSNALIVLVAQACNFRDLTHP